MCLSAVWMSSSGEKKVYVGPGSFFKLDCLVLLLLSCINSSHISGTSPLSERWFYVFSPILQVALSLGGSFPLLHGSFSFDADLLVYFCFCACFANVCS